MNIIVSIGNRNEIGCENNLLWPIREDLRRFKALTTGHPIIMGRNTWFSLPRRPLPGRLNIVVSQNPDFIPEGEGVLKASSLEEALRIARSSESYGEKEPFVIGGGRLYAAALPLAQRLFLTRVDAVAPYADTFFPSIDSDLWETEEVSESFTAELPSPEPPQERESVSYRFQTLRRK
ncbi:MAG: dihydrofolate reductase [Bacteroides sp.]|nr:dihydrofolate reductase [Bacteroides sp.]MBD5307008.1 dihydrofolate reductase [Bacteroides sp.]